MNKAAPGQYLVEVEAAVDPEKARLAAFLLEQGWPLWQVREHLDWLENVQPAPQQQRALSRCGDADRPSEQQNGADRRIEERVPASHQEHAAVT